ncbi:MAG: hypothetical protein MZV64_42735 [Ignavibacteriales bacterium]|nr:hypothetical protein [Ignavibacteriales bacterium]
MQRVELRARPHPLRAQPREPLCGVAARSEPDGVDPELPEAASAVDDLLGDAAVDPAQRHWRRLRARRRTAGRGGDREQETRVANQPPEKTRRPGHSRGASWRRDCFTASRMLSSLSACT